MTTIERIARDIRAAAPKTLTCNGEGVVAIPLRLIRELDEEQRKPKNGLKVWCCGCGVLLSDGIEIETRERCETCAERRAR